MGRIALIIALLTATLAVNAQEYHRCMYDEVVALKKLQDPNYQHELDQMRARAYEYIQNKSERISNKTNDLEIDTTLRIPVVVHIVYLDAQQDVHDSLVHSQIEVLNRDFNRLNADTVDTRPDFKPIAGSLNIEFYLAEEDPMGNPTTGITRTSGSPGMGTFSPFNDNVKSTAQGGIDAWPTDEYLNIWVCELLFGFGVLGYAYPPPNTPNWDPGSVPTDAGLQGVVIHWQAFGRNNPDAIAPGVDKGRTAVHEMGHYLGLRHIWGDGACNEDDGIHDTPLSDAASNQNCDHTRNSCVDPGAVDHFDMVENYMDYSTEACQNMFTKGQAEFMHAVLMTSRSELVEMQFDSTGGVGFDHIRTERRRGMVIYPNPSSQGESVSLKLDDVDDMISQVALYDLMGKQLANYQIEVPTNTYQMSFADHPLGLGTYVVKAWTSKGRQYVKPVSRN